MSPALSSTSNMPTILFLMFILATPSLCQLYLYRPGPISSGKLRVLSSSDSICKTDYPTGITIRCVSQKPEIDTKARFLVNGERVRFEAVAPFFIAGDSGMRSKKWMPLPEGSAAEVKCELPRSKTTFTSVIDFTCSDESPPPSPSASPMAESPSTTPMPSPSPSTAMYSTGTILFAPAGPDASSVAPIRVTDDMSFCPMREFGSSSYTILCAAGVKGDVASSAKFRVRRQRATSTYGPLFPAGGVDTEGNFVPTAFLTGNKSFVVCLLRDVDGKRIVKSKRKRVRISCPPTPSPSMSPTASESMPGTTTPSPSPSDARLTPSPSPSDDDMPMPEDGCVMFQPQDTVLTEGWEKRNNGAAEFRPNDDSRKLTKRGVASLCFTFKAPQKSRLAVVLDMKTGGRTEHNDVFLRMTSGFRLVQKGEEDIFTEPDVWVKGYHNFNTRAAFVKSIDKNGRAINSGKVFNKGDMVEICVSGRSSKVTLYNVLLFPCGGANGCYRRAEWRMEQEKCLPGSTNYKKK